MATAVGRSVARRAKELDVEPKAFTDAWEEALDGREGLAHASCGHSKLRQRLHRAGDVHGARRSDLGAAPKKQAQQLKIDEHRLFLRVLEVQKARETLACIHPGC